MVLSDLQPQRSTLADQIEEHIRGLIVSDQLSAGQLLPSTLDLAANFGVSRTIVREAMKSLQAKGLIEIANGKRASVLPVTNTVLIDYFNRFASNERGATVDLLELRRGIEVQSATLAARRRSDEDMAQLWAHVHRMGEVLGDSQAFLDVDVALHLSIARASKNEMIFHLVASIRQVMRNTMWEGLVRQPDQTTWQHNLSSHILLVKMIDEQNAEGAGTSMANHFDDAIHNIMFNERGHGPVTDRQP